jgi:hypothetical protein
MDFILNVIIFLVADFGYVFVGRLCFFFTEAKQQDVVCLGFVDQNVFVPKIF